MWTGMTACLGAAAVVLAVSTDYGRPMKPFFIEIQNFWAWAEKIEQINSGAFGVFSTKLSALILVQ